MVRFRFWKSKRSRAYTKHTHKLTNTFAHRNMLKHTRAHSHTYDQHLHTNKRVGTIYIYIYMCVCVCVCVCVTLCRWPAKQTIPLSVLAQNERKGFGLEISAWPEVVTGRKKRVGWTKELSGVGDGTRTEAFDSGHRSREASQHELGSSDSEEDRVKMSRHSSCFIEFSLVTHASVSLYMQSGMQSVA